MKIFALMFLVFTSFTSWGQNKKAIAGYENVYDINSEGKPSKCDCDYRKKELVLYADSTFFLEESKGRLDKEIRLSETGTWAVENDSVLVLRVKQTSRSPGSHGANKNSGVIYLKTFIIAKQGIRPYPDEIWKGRGLVSNQTKKTP